VCQEFVERLREAQKRLDRVEEILQLVPQPLEDARRVAADEAVCVRHTEVVELVREPIQLLFRCRPESLFEAARERGQDVPQRVAQDVTARTLEHVAAGETRRPADLTSDRRHDVDDVPEADVGERGRHGDSRRGLLRDVRELMCKQFAPDARRRLVVARCERDVGTDRVRPRPERTGRGRRGRMRVDANGTQVEAQLRLEGTADM
jgi:hypothetical protein